MYVLAQEKNLGTMSVDAFIDLVKSAVAERTGILWSKKD